MGEEVITVKDLLERIEGHVLRVEVKVDAVITNGCAGKSEQDRRLNDLEGWRNKGVVGLVSSLVALLGTMALAFWQFYITAGAPQVGP